MQPCLQPFSLLPSSSKADDSSEDEDSSNDESDQESNSLPENEPHYPRTSNPKGKRRAPATAARTAKKTRAGGPWSGTPAGARRAGGASSSVAAGGGRTADVEANPWEGLPGLSLCQFWRYRLLLEVVLAARGGDGGGDERSDGGGLAELPRTEFVEVRGSNCIGGGRLRRGRLFCMAQLLVRPWTREGLSLCT